jgi:hypothetical protein
MKSLIVRYFSVHQYFLIVTKNGNGNENGNQNGNGNESDFGNL